MYGSNSHKMCLYDEKAWSVAIVGRKGIRRGNGCILDWRRYGKQQSQAQNFVV